MTDPWGDADAPVRHWESGHWSIEVRGAELAEVSYRGRRVLRSVRAIVRDRDWNTAGWVIDDTAERPGALALTVRSEGFGSDIRGELRVTAADGLLTVAFDGVSLDDFETSRTGLVVLHPPELAGAELAVTHPDGSVTSTAFPEAISPHQPAFDIAGLAWTHGGIDVALRFDGDVFEMEDQRNWTDASFKTYSRPLSLPTPYPLAAGERVIQAVTISAAESAAGSAAGSAARAAVVEPAAEADGIVLAAGGAFPEISVAASTEPGERPAIGSVGSNLLVELDLAQPRWRGALERAARVGLPLDVRIVPGPTEGDAEDGAFDRVAAALFGVPLVRVAAFASSGPAAHVSDAATVRSLRLALARAGVDAPIIGGVRSHFTELNREHERLPDGLDGIAFSTTPLFHSLDTPQLVEALAMQRLVAQQAVEIAGGTPVHVGPVTLRPRFNNVAASDSPSHLDPSVDPRQGSPALAAWTIASAAALAVPGVASLSFFEEWGPRGIRTSSGQALPAAAAVEELAALATPDARGSERPRLLTGDSPDGLVWAIGTATSTSTRLLAANLDSRERRIRVTHPAGALTLVVPSLSFVARDA